jgi:hypothetical protein
MFGIPFTVRRSETGGMSKDEVLYLRTYRRGETGNLMRKLIKQYRYMGMEQAKAGAKAAMMVAGLGAIAAGTDETRDLAKVLAEQSEAMRAAEAAGAEALKTAEEIAVIALTENYGEGTDKLVDALTDHELHGIVSTIELGSMPKDFFPSPDTQQKPKSTTVSGT